MPPLAIVGVIGAAASLWGSINQQRAAKEAARKAGEMMSPHAIRQRIKTMNPMLYNAVYGENIFSDDMQEMNSSKTFGAYLDKMSSLSTKVSENRLMAMNRMAGWQDPIKMNYGLQMGEAAINTASRSAGANVGRRSMEGGMADAYAFANEAMKGQMKSSAWNQFRIKGEELAREDTMNVQSSLNSAWSNATSGAQQQAAYRAQERPVNWGGAIGQGISTGLAAYSGFKGLQGAGQAWSPGNSGFRPPQQAPNYGGLNNPYLPPSNSYAGWWSNTPAYGSGDSLKIPAGGGW